MQSCLQAGPDLLRGSIPKSCVCGVACLSLCASLQVVAACVALLTGPHDRSHLPAVQVLQALAASPMQVSTAVTVRITESAPHQVLVPA